MSNKARPPMTKPEEVIAWAEETRAGNGEAFTMLKKEEQLLIANFILAMRDHIRKIQNTSAEKKPEAAVSEPKAAETGIPILERQFVDRRQTNMEFFKANNVPMQTAYQQFCIWRKCDEQNRTILDEERKAYVKAASFAFWLNLPHE